MYTIILLILAAASNAICDVLKNFYYVSKFRKLNYKFWNPEISYLNMWEVHNVKEKFFGSTTIFCWICDAWHLFKAIWLVSIIGAIISAWYTEPLFGWYFSPLLFMCWGITFEGVFRYLKKA